MVQEAYDARSPLTIPLNWPPSVATPYPAAPDFPLKGKRLTTFCASLALLQNVFAVHPRESVSRNFQSPNGSLQISFACHPYAGGRINPQGSNDLISTTKHSTAKSPPSGCRNRPLFCYYCESRQQILPPSPFPDNKKRTPEGVLFFIH